MSVNNYEDLRKHINHKIACVCYGDADNVSVECETCCEVLMDFDKEDVPEEEDIPEQESGPSGNRSHWDNDPEYPPEDWQAEVANGNTRQGYGDWVERQKELAMDKKEEECQSQPGCRSQ